MLWNAVSRYRTHVANALVICKAVRSARLAWRQLTARPPRRTCCLRTSAGRVGIPRQPVTSLTRYQQVWPICRRQNHTFLSDSLLYKSSYCSVVRYAKTVDERKFQLFYGHLKRSCEGCSLPTYKPDTILRGHTTIQRRGVIIERCWRRPSFNPSSLLTGIADDTTPTPYRRFSLLTPSVCRRRRQRPDADDTTSTLCRRVSSLSLLPVDARSRFIRLADAALRPWSRRPGEVCRHRHAACLLRWLVMLYS